MQDSRTHWSGVYAHTPVTRGANDLTSAHPREAPISSMPTPALRGAASGLKVGVKTRVTRCEAVLRIYAELVEEE